MMDMTIDRERMHALRTYEVLEWDADPAFDRVTALAAQICRTPIALITFITETQQSIKSGFGIDLGSTPPSHFLCSHTLAQDEPLIVLDTHLDPRFANNPLVTGRPAIRFYGGVRLLTPEGVPVGALCVMDDVVRESVSLPEKSALHALAEMVTGLLDQRCKLRAAARLTRRSRVTESILDHMTRAASNNAAADVAMRNIAIAYGAACGQLWHRSGAHPGFRHTSVQSNLSVAPETIAFLPGSSQPGGLADLVAAALCDGQPLCLSLGYPVTLKQDYSLTAFLAKGTRNLLIIPLSAGDDEFGLLLGFGARTQDLSIAVEDVVLIGETLKPALARRAEQENFWLLRSALALASDGVIITARGPTQTAPVRIVYVNESFCRMSGYDAAELLGRSPDVLHGEQTNQAAIGKLRAELSAGNAASAVLLNYRKDQTTFDAEITFAPMTGADGEQRYAVGLLRDITAKLADERRRQELDASFRTMFQANPLPKLVFDRISLRFLMVNDAAVRFYGWSREELLAMTVQDIQAPDTAVDPRCLDGTRTMSERGIWAHRRADGSSVLMGGVSQRHPAAGTDGVLLVMWDITEIQAAREELKNNYERMSDLAAQLRARTDELTNASRLAQLGTWKLSPDRRQMSWSDEIYTLLGRERSSFPPSIKHWIEVLHPDDHKLFSRSILTLGTNQSCRQIEARIFRPDGRIRHVRIELCPANLGDERGEWLGYVQDISDRWESQQALMRSEKLAILGQLTGGVAHDFNNLLTVVTLNLEEVIAELPETDELQAILVAALQAAQRGADLTNQLLAYARQAPLRPKVTSLAALFKTSGPLIRRALGAKHTLCVEVQDDRCTPLVDASQLQTAILNIALNARDAMPQGGEILIKAALVSLPAAAYPVDAPPGRYAMISVIDSGQGIPPDILPHIFEPFYTTKGVASSGLGLSMVDGFVGQSGGRTHVVSKAGEGTTIRLFLPITAEQNTEAAAGTKARRALLVEDQAAVLATVSRMFTQLGYSVSAVENAAGALAELDRGEEFAIMFADICLPGDMDGIELARVAAKRAPSMPILLTSGYTEHDLSQLELPRVDILMKPYKRSDLLDRLNRVVLQPAALVME